MPVNTAAPRPRTRFDSITRRFVLTLTLVPIVPAASLMVAAVMDTFAPGTNSASRCFQISLTVLWMAGLLVICRTAVMWTLGRTGLTALVSVLPLVQVVWNRPLWNAGCISDGLLLAGQNFTSCGLWTWLTVWVWWGMEKAVMADEERVRSSRRSAWLARLGASLGMLPIACGLFWIVAVFFETFTSLGPTSGIAWTYGVCAAVMLAAWLMIWRRPVAWDEGVLAMTLISWLLLVGVPVVALLFVPGIFTGPLWQTLSYSAPLLGWGLWLGWTMWYWPMRAEALLAPADEPSCLKCGYSLRGLKATRCPECGDEPTIDELWAGSVISNQ